MTTPITQSMGGSPRQSRLVELQAEVNVSPKMSRSGSSNSIKQDYMASKVSETSSYTQIVLL